MLGTILLAAVGLALASFVMNRAYKTHNAHNRANVNYGFSRAPRRAARRTKSQDRKSRRSQKSETVQQIAAIPAQVGNDALSAISESENMLNSYMAGVNKKEQQQNNKTR